MTIAISAEPWVVDLTAVTASGNLTQCYPLKCSPGGVYPTAVWPAQIRRPTEGVLYSAEVETDGQNGGEIQIYDISGIDALADVSSTTAITNTQLTTLIASGKAQLIYSQRFAADVGAKTVGLSPRSFNRGLAARFVGSSGACKLNLVVLGGYKKVITCNS